MMLSLFLCGCARENNSTNETDLAKETKNSDAYAALESNEVVESVQSSSTVEEVNEIALTGKYLLDECMEKNGFYIAYKDGSFDYYYTGGYCQGIRREVATFEGMYLEDEIMQKNPIITPEDNMVLFWEGDYFITLHPVIAEIPVVQIEVENGEDGFAHFISDTSLGVFYKDNEWENIEVQTIDGMPAEEYVKEEVKIETTPSAGMPSVVEMMKLRGFKKNTTVTLGIAEGSTLIEKAYEVDTTYYYCDPRWNHYEEEDFYYLANVPTAQGYARIDFSAIPSGRYIMVINTGKNTYRATLVEWQDSN